MPIRLLRPGLFTTVQDLGRWGWQRYGVVVGGAMDRRSLQIANLLVGNVEHAAGLEITVVGPQLRFEQEALIAICGAELAPQVNGRSIPHARPVYIPPDSLLDCGSVTSGCRAYLAVAGSLDVPLVLDSRSTYVASGIGGLAGRALLAGDTLVLGKIGPVGRRVIESLRSTSQNGSPSSTSWGAALPSNSQSSVVRVIPGSEFERMPSESRLKLLESEFEITSRSDRMGYRLSGPSMTCDCPELISEGVTIGTIQLPPDGQLIVLMADCATTGGYAKVLHVAAVDVPKIAQSPPGTKIRFEKITLPTAHDLYRAEEADMNRLRNGVSLKFAQL